MMTYRKNAASRKYSTRKPPEALYCAFFSTMLLASPYAVNRAFGMGEMPRKSNTNITPSMVLGEYFLIGMK